jgi:SAM-dependent methyltransferase
MRLNVGSGIDYRDGWINLDYYNPAYKIDVMHDLNIFPYPFEDNSFDEIECKMVLEHLSNPIKTLQEFIRISKSGCKIHIVVPHATTYANFTAFDHRANFTESSFDEKILLEAGLSEMKLTDFHFIYVNKWKKYIPFKGYLKIFLNGLYDDLSFTFEVIKNKK